MKKTLIILSALAAAGWGREAATASEIEWNWKGDALYRYESSRLDGDSRFDGSHRIGLHFGAFPKINDEIKGGIEVATGASNPTSRLYVLGSGDAFSMSDLMLNQAYLEIRPLSYGLEGNAALSAGKRDVSECLVRVNDLLWDTDVTLEGLTLQYGRNGKKLQQGLSATAGYYILDEAAGTANDPSLWTAQLAWSGKSGGVDYMLGGSYYDYMNIDGVKITDWAYQKPDITDASTYGNSYTGNGVDKVLTYDYNVLEFFANAGGKFGSGLPWKVYGQYASNIASGVDNNDTAYLVGGTLGKADKVGKWSFDANYCYLEKDAILGAFTDGTRFKGGTDGQGIKLTAQYQLIKDLNVALKYYNHEKVIDSGNRYQLWQADMLVKF
ncbi:MAG TPA: hypothetical protein DEQ23_07105 [Chlorobium sp.]|uniref:Porin n=1 Tax=Chlorobium phaeovibrioides (strain DSM 265 / 1930) TaxID=290318 RepID=A4SCB9_CHLPM|nr:hypothetical protein [Chlorobium sp.]